MNITQSLWLMISMHQLWLTGSFSWFDVVLFDDYRVELDLLIKRWDCISFKLKNATVILILDHALGAPSKYEVLIISSPITSLWNNRITQWLERLAQNRKILGLRLSHTECPMWKWALHITPSPYRFNRRFIEPDGRVPRKSIMHHNVCQIGWPPKRVVIKENVIYYSFSYKGRELFLLSGQQITEQKIKILKASAEERWKGKKMAVG